MEKILKLLFILFLFAGGLYANFDKEFASIQKQMHSQPSKAYTDLQSLYLHLILEGSDAQKVKVLNALIETSKKLNFNYNRYEEALKEISKEQKPQKTTQKNTASTKVKKIFLKENTLVVEFNKQLQIKKKFTLKSDKLRYVYDFDAVLPDVSKSFTYDNTAIKVSQFDKDTIRVVFTTPKKITINTKNKKEIFTFTLPLQKTPKKSQTTDKLSQIKNTSLNDGVLKIDFNAQTSYKDFILQKDKIRYVYDLHTVFPQVSKSYTYNGIGIKISQFDAKTTRVVLTTDKKLSLKPVISQNSFILSLGKKQSTTSTTPQQMKKFRVVLDPGHGGKDPGAVGYRGYREKVIVLNITKDVKRYLEKSGIEVILTRSNDKFIKLGSRTKFANQKDADVFVSIHANASNSKSLNGIETYFLSPARSERAKRVAAKENKDVMDKMAQWSSKNTFLTLMNREKIIESNKLAIDIQKNMLYNVTRKYTSVRDGGVREAPFWVLIGAQMPAVLVELGYITNSKEANRLVLKKYRPYQDALAKGIAEGIINYLSLAKG